MKWLEIATDAAQHLHTQKINYEISITSTYCTIDPPDIKEKRLTVTVGKFSHISRKFLSLLNFCWQHH